MNITLWILPALLAAVFAAHGWMLLFPPPELLPVMNEQLGVGFRLFLGVAEIAGAIGLLLPAMTRKLPWLMPLAAACLAFVVASATVLHLSRGETSSAVTTAILFLLAIIALGRALASPLGASDAAAAAAPAEAAGPTAVDVALSEKGREEARKGGEDPLVLFRRVIAAAYEDVGLADPRAALIATQAMQAYERLGPPEGYLPLANAIVSPSTKRPTATLNAVLPLPKTSYEKPSRGERSFQSTTERPAKLCCGSQTLAGSTWSGTLVFSQSMRSPRFIVRRLIVQRSCTKNPQSPSTLS